MKGLLRVLLVLAVVLTVPSFGTAAEEHTATATASHGIVHRLVMYVPNRILDVFDIVRLRVRVGPGLAAGVRATEVASAFVGSYDTVYVGLPGPRNRPLPKSPIGVESRSGVQVSLADASETGGAGPDYGPAEFGAGAQALVVGLDVGIDPVEIVDLLTGFLFIDLRNDDL